MTANFLEKKDRISLSIENMYSKFGFIKYRMNKFEPYSFYMENEHFLSDSRIITCYGQSGKLLALKPDITMSIVKSCLKNKEKNHKIYYNESVFRIPKGDDEFREIHQVGVEFIGEIDLYQTLEILNLATRSLSEISEDYMLCISNMALILTAFEELSLKNSQKDTIISYMQQKNVHDLEKYIESEQILGGEVFVKTINVSGNIYKAIDELYEIFAGERYQKELLEIKKVVDNLKAIIPCEKVVIDFSHISSTEYYNELIFTGYIKGLAVPILTGGRYDKLLSKMGLSKNALGFAIDLSQVEKLDAPEKKEVLEIKYDENSSVLELIEQSNKLFSEGKTFIIKK